MHQYMKQDFNLSIMRLHADHTKNERPKKRRLGRDPQDHAHAVHHKKNPKGADDHSHAQHHKISNWVKKREKENPKPPAVKHWKEKSKHDCETHEELKTDYDWNALDGK